MFAISFEKLFFNQIQVFVLFLAQCAIQEYHVFD